VDALGKVYYLKKIPFLERSTERSFLINLAKITHEYLRFWREIVVRNTHLVLRNSWIAMVGHICSPRYSGGTGRRMGFKACPDRKPS
jgi:hypothetical protein